MSGRSFGYARVSTDDQDLTLQLDALTGHGIAASRIFKDRLFGARCDRPRLEFEEAKVLAAKKLAKDTSISIDDICRTLNISRSSYYRYLAMRPDEPRDQIG